MSETHEETTTVVDSPDTIAEPGADSTTDAPEGANPNAEAARYRVRAREAETALATAQARIEQLTRLDIERIAGESLSMPVDFWLSGNDASSYINEDTGLVDVERVREDAKILVSERPGLAKYSPAYDPTQGSGNVTPGKSGPTWDTLLK